MITGDDFCEAMNIHMAELAAAELRSGDWFTREGVDYASLVARIDALFPDREMGGLFITGIALGWTLHRESVA